MKTADRGQLFGEFLGVAGRTAVVTGGGVNIGRAICLRLGLLGVKTAVVYNSSDKSARAICEIITSAGGTASAFQADVSSEESVRALFESVVKDDRFGRVDILVNNSGVFSVSEQTGLAAAEWQRIFDINVKGIFLCSREAVRIMKKQPLLEGCSSRGVIVNIASINALHPGFGGTAHYDAAKGAVQAYTRSLAAELGPDAIRVNAAAPGLVDSEGLRHTAAGLAEMVEKRTPLSDSQQPDKLVSAQDVADTVLYLSSSLSSAVTGETVVVDRGYLLS